MTGAPLLSFEDLTIAFRRGGEWRAAVRGVDLQVEPGEAVGLIGESGCGKSTLAMASLGYLPENARIMTGEVSLMGESMMQMPPARLQHHRGNTIAAVYQDPAAALNPSLTIGRQITEIYEYQRGLGAKEAIDAAAGILEQVRIADPGQLLDAYPHQISGGMQQRVVIAMALAGEPDLLVLDEPTTALDASIQAEVLSLFADLRRDLDVAMLLISHDLTVVRAVCDRAAVMYAGEVVESAPVNELFERPQHPYTASLIDCIPTGYTHWSDERLASIPGYPPALGERAPGCAFASRCPVARAACREQPVELASVGSEHTSRCLFPEDTAAPGGNRPPATSGQAPGAVVLETEDLVVGYKDVRVLDGITLDVRAGETLALVGESGSGKSTLARALTGLTIPESGTVRLDRKVLPGPQRRRGQQTRRALQMVFQSPENTLNTSHHVGPALARAIRKLGGLGFRAARALVPERLDQVALEADTANRLPAQLSGGQRQRVAIARAFAGDPEAVILDEPTSALDVSVQAAVLDLLIDLQQRSGTAYLFISHDLAVVRYIADRVAVLFLGRIMEVGPVEAIFTGARHPYTAELLAAIPGMAEGHTSTQGRGSITGPGDRPTGCPYASRCPYVMPVCEDNPPPVREPETGHQIHCHLPVEELPGASRE
ncbi:ABC transporter ATP-binding protein [Spiribacter vilamensis]|uniref:ABC-type dipeptide transporter n=1 Tax=Spiribacter vilamensis TaxID=531306 RepID=A0A4Q8CZH2_9GAMM|nr:ABC transporter ATP-binding protein [Spiribacter vilamensis]RZU98419.1 peptide/nickel transport system ATP-binding protein [Spiribacter vilamensis]TVO60704.1 ABC transporter ATP-binding protein [Spiribacter vilamensis]